MWSVSCVLGVHMTSKHMHDAARCVRTWPGGGVRVPSVPLYLDHHRLVMGVTSSMLLGREYPPGRRDGNGRSAVPGEAIV